MAHFQSEDIQSLIFEEALRACEKSAALGISRSGGARNPHVFQHTLRLLVSSLGLAPSGLALRFAPAERDLSSLATIFFTTSALDVGRLRNEFVRRIIVYDLHRGLTMNPGYLSTNPFSHVTTIGHATEHGPEKPGVHVKELSEGDRHHLLTHFLALDASARLLRFGMVFPDELITTLSLIHI